MEETIKIIHYAQIQLRASKAYHEINELARLLAKYEVSNEEHEILASATRLLAKYQLTFDPILLKK